MEWEKVVLVKIQHWRICLCQVNVNCVNVGEGNDGIDGVHFLMRLKVNQDLNWAIWGNDSAETSGAKEACEVTNTELILFICFNGTACCR